jgi:hypothetical protein
LSSSECWIWKLELSFSGGDSIRRRKLFSSQLTKPFSGRLALHEALLAGGGGFFSSRRFSITCSGAWADDGADGVESAAARAAGDLLEIPHRQRLGTGAVVFEELGEHHGADRHVHADAQRVGAADTFSRPRWVSFSTSTRYFGSSPAWWMPMPWRSSLAISLPYGLRKSARRKDIPAMACFSSLRAEIRAHQVLRGLGAGELGEMHQIDRRLAGLHQFGHFFLQRRLAVFELQRHRALLGFHQHGRAPC